MIIMVDYEKNDLLFLITCFKWYCNWFRFNIHFVSLLESLDFDQSLIIVTFGLGSKIHSF